MTFEEAIQALEDRQEVRIELGLERVAAHLARLGSPQEGLAAIHVAGTNGKGSVCAILESVLRAAGHKTGLYTSPHLTDVRERIKAGGSPISEASFARLMEKTLKADPGGRLTYFELLTSIAFQYFAQSGVEAAILETGLGGRLDATNVIGEPLACVITSIDLDHTQFLGGTLAKIASEKAGIIKGCRPVVIPGLPPAAHKAVSDRARVMNAPLTVVGEAWKTVSVDWAANSQVLEDPKGKRWTLGLLGDRQGRNAALSWAAVEASGLRVPVSAWKRGLARVQWPGRVEVRREGGRTLVLDGAHNVEAMRNLRATLEASPWLKGEVRFIMGFLKDKDVAGMLREIAPLLRDVVLVRPPSPRALDPKESLREVKRLAPGAKARTAVDLDRALEDAPQTVVVCGSFYLVGAFCRSGCPVP